MELTEAITKAVGDCIEEGILAEFLKQNSTEVINMLTEEWNLERAIYIRQQEAREDGLEEGRREGRLEGREEGIGIGFVIANELRSGMTVQEVAKKHHMTEQSIMRIQTELEKLLQPQK